MLDITTNIGCKNACIFCAQDKLIEAYSKRSSTRMMSFSTFKICLDKVSSTVLISFTGRSECWLNPECTNMIIYTHKKGHKIQVSTTLVGLTLEDIDIIEAIPFFNFTIHLPCNEGYDKIKVDEMYLAVLNRIASSRIQPRFMIVAGTVHNAVKSVLGHRLDISMYKKKPFTDILSIAGNVNIVKTLSRKKGIIKCCWHLRHNALFPNGDIALCCQDFKMQHILGNLLTSDYDSLFHSDEFLKIKQGLHDASLDILCRHCEMAHNVNLTARIYNPFRYRLSRIHDFKSLLYSLSRIPNYVYSAIFTKHKK